MTKHLCLGRHKNAAGNYNDFGGGYNDRTVTKLNFQLSLLINDAIVIFFVVPYSTLDTFSRYIL